ncbi:MAG: hypothetical protein KC619_09665 [Myxococcales bacterium]|nr:hypothetical protein [Myxococcales bacterium]
MRYEIDNPAGCLITARVHALATAEDADTYSADLGSAVRGIRGDRQPVLLADHRPVAVYPQPATDRLVELFQQMNRRLARVAILVAPSNATMYLQLSRLVREAGFENRRVFQQGPVALEFIGRVLQPHEIVAAESFLAELDG